MVPASASASAPLCVGVASLPTAAAARSEASHAQAPRLARDHSQRNTNAVKMDGVNDRDVSSDESSSDESTSDEEDSSSSSSCSSDSDDTLLLPTRDGARSLSSSATHSSPSSPTVSVEIARAFVNLDREYRFLFSPSKSSWVCLHTCSPRDCRTNSFADRGGAIYHNVNTAMHHGCGPQCVMHQYQTLRHRAHLPDAESRDRWEECKRLAPDVPLRRYKRCAQTAEQVSEKKAKKEGARSTPSASRPTALHAAPAGQQQNQQHAAALTRLRSSHQAKVTRLTAEHHDRVRHLEERLAEERSSSVEAAADATAAKSAAAASRSAHSQVTLQLRQCQSELDAKSSDLLRANRCLTEIRSEVQSLRSRTGAADINLQVALAASRSQQRDAAANETELKRRLQSCEAELAASQSQVEVRRVAMQAMADTITHLHVRLRADT